MVQFNTVKTDGAFWDSFYGSIIGNGIGSPGRAGEPSGDGLKAYNFFNAGRDPVGKGAVFGDLASFIGEKFITLPDGQQVQSVSPGTDLLNKIFGTSPLSGDFYKNPEGETVAPGSGAPDIFEGIGGMVSRVAIIILGFIFVAVGLSMFRGDAVKLIK